jgi:hypothetical protein
MLRRPLKGAPFIQTWEVPSGELMWEQLSPTVNSPILTTLVQYFLVGFGWDGFWALLRYIHCLASCFSRTRKEIAFSFDNKEMPFSFSWAG